MFEYTTLDDSEDDFKYNLYRISEYNYRYVVKPFRERKTSVTYWIQCRNYVLNSKDIKYKTLEKESIIVKTTLFNRMSSIEHKTLNKKSLYKPTLYTIGENHNNY